MQKCKICEKPVITKPGKTKPDKTKPSIRVTIPSQSASDSDKRFIYVFPHISASKYCDYHHRMRKQKEFDDHIERLRAQGKIHPETGIIKGY